MTGRPEQKILIIAGPNGAGKAAFAEEFLPNEAACPTFINADLIAAGLSPFADLAAIKAGRLFIAPSSTNGHSTTTRALNRNCSKKKSIHDRSSSAGCPA